MHICMQERLWGRCLNQYLSINNTQYIMDVPGRSLDAAPADIVPYISTWELMDVYVPTIHILMQILIVYGPPSTNWQAVGRCPTLPALGKTCMHLVSCVKNLLCFTSEPYPGMHWLLCLCLSCYISILHKQKMMKVNPMRSVACTHEKWRSAWRHS